MATVQVAVVDEDGNPRRGVTVVAYNLDNFPAIQATGVTDDTGTVALSTTGPAFYDAFDRRGVSFRDRSYSGKIQIQVISFQNSPCYDYVVDSDGYGTHLSVREMMADFLVEAASTSNVRRSVWMCSDDTDTNIECGSSNANVATAQLHFWSSGSHRSNSTATQGQRQSLNLTVLAANDGYFKTTLLYSPQLNFHNLRLTSSSTSTAHAFVRQIAASGSSVTPRVDCYDCEFSIGSSANTNGVLLSYNGAAGTGSGGYLRLYRCTGTVGMLYAYVAGFAAGGLSVYDSEITVFQLCQDVTTSTMSYVIVDGGSITTTGYLVQNSSGSTATYTFRNATFRHTGASVWFRFASAQIGSGTHIYMEGINYSQSSSTLGAATISAPAFGSNHTVFVDSCEFRSDSANAATAVVVSGSNWLSAHGGNIGFPNFAAGSSGFTSGSSAHESDTTDAHDASAISILDTAADFTATNVEDALAELQSDAEAHLSDTSDAHDASAISLLDTGGFFTATEVEAALAELAAGTGPFLRKDGTTALTGNWVQSGAFDIYTAGALRVGSSSAPTNTTAGDGTFNRLFIPDVALGSETRLVQLTDTWTPVGGAFHSMGILAFISPGVGAASDEYRTAAFDMSVIPTAAYTGNARAFNARISHDSGAFNIATMESFFGQVAQNVAGTTLTDARVGNLVYRAVAGTITTAQALIIQKGLVGDAGAIGTGVGLDILASAGAIPSVADIGVRTRGTQHNRFVGGAILGADAAPTAGYMLDVRAGNARFEIGGVLKLDILTGSITVGVDGSAPRLILAAMDGTNEGGEIVLNGAAANVDWTLDNNAANLRWFESAAVRMQLFSGASPAVRLRVLGKLLVDTELELDGDLNHDGSNIGFFGTAPAVKDSVADMTNNVTSGGTAGQLDDFAGLVYPTDAASIRNDIYQLGQKVNELLNALQSYGLV